jgi:hypothetical protein
LAALQGLPATLRRFGWLRSLWSDEQGDGQQSVHALAGAEVQRQESVPNTLERCAITQCRLLHADVLDGTRFRDRHACFDRTFGVVVSPTSEVNAVDYIRSGASQGVDYDGAVAHAHILRAVARLLHSNPAWSA